MTVAAHPLQRINIRAACFVIGATIAKASRPAMRLVQATRRQPAAQVWSRLLLLRETSLARAPLFWSTSWTWPQRAAAVAVCRVGVQALPGQAAKSQQHQLRFRVRSHNCTPEAGDKRDVILSHGLVCVIDGVLVVTTQLPSRNRAG